MTATATLNRQNHVRRRRSPPLEPISTIIAEHIGTVTGLETRITSPGHVQRGVVPTPTDRVLSTSFGATAAECVRRGEFGVMVAKRGEEYVPVPLGDVTGKKRTVPLDHPWIDAARTVGTCLGDEIPHGYRD